MVLNQNLNQARKTVMKFYDLELKVRLTEDPKLTLLSVTN